MSPDAAFDSWIKNLRTDDTAFREASVLMPTGRWEWQAAAYLLTVSPDLWAFFGPMTMRDQHFGLVAVDALALYGFDEEGDPDSTVTPRRDPASYTGSDSELLSWTQYLWTSQWIEGTPPIPMGLDPRRYERWIAALLIRRGQTPPR